MFFERGEIMGCRWERQSDNPQNCPDREVIERIMRELFSLFGMETVDFKVTLTEHFAYPVEVRTELSIGTEGGAVRQSGQGVADERERAAVHRLFKLQLYRLMREKLVLPSAPWGILHGVRPTKIAHRWLDSGAKGEEVIARLQNDYDASEDKARLLTEVALRQRPFLAKSDERTIGVYIGIPFCLSRCLYCSFPSYVLPGEKKLSEFLQAFRRDLAAAATAVERHGFKVQSIYMGGGTPTALPDDIFAEIMATVRESFFQECTQEFTVEAGRPDSLSAAKIAVMSKYGATRVSVNPQTMQAATLQRIGRRHTPEDVLGAYRNLRESGNWQINMDVILGLPGETAADVADTMKKIIALQPDDITLHALALKKGSRLKLALDRKSQSAAELTEGQGENISLPDDAETRRMSEIALSYIRQAGMNPYYLYRQGYMRGQLENIGCARPGAESVYNIQIMEERQTILGVGCAAVTKVADERAGRLKSAFNAKDLIIYKRDIDNYIDKRNRLLNEVYKN